MRWPWMELTDVTQCEQSMDVDFSDISEYVRTLFYLHLISLVNADASIVKVHYFISRFFNELPI